MSVGDLARYLLVSRQSLSGLIGRMERDGHVAGRPDGNDRRSRLVSMTASGREIGARAHCPRSTPTTSALADFSINDMAHTLHYLLKMIDNMQGLDAAVQSAGHEPFTKALQTGHQPR